MSDIKQVEPFKAEYFEKFFRLNDNCFLVMSDYGFHYKDLNFDKLTISTFFVSHINDVYTIKIYREIDQKIILEAKLKRIEDKVNLIEFKLETAFKYENKSEKNENNIKDVILFCLILAHGKLRDLTFGYFDEEEKIKFAEIFKDLQIVY